MKKEESCFLVVVRSSDKVAIQESKHRGMTQVVKRETMKHIGLVKLKSVQEGKKEVLAKMAQEHREGLNTLLEKHLSVFIDKLPYGAPLDCGVVHPIDLEENVELVSRAPYWLSPNEQDEMEEQIKDLLTQGFTNLPLVLGMPLFLFVLKKDG